MNSLLQDYKLNHDAVAFDKIQISDYIPAIQEAIQIARKNIDTILKSPSSFQNTILGLENSSNLLDRILGVYFNLHSAEATEELQALAGEISKISAQFSSEVSLNEALFLKIKEVKDSSEFAKLNDEQKILVSKVYKSFCRNGALLEPSKKDQLKKIDEELSQLGPKFSDNVLKATNAFIMNLKTKEEVAGLPESILESAQELAKEKNLEGYAFNLQAPSYIPFMKYSKNRSAREKLWRAFNSRAHSGENSNHENIKNIVSLRHQRAKLLGFKDHASFVLEERMAQSPQKVIDFLNQLLVAAKPKAIQDVNEVKALAKKLDQISDLKPWDFSYYSELLQKEKYNFDEEILKPYFELNKVVEGVFLIASKLYNLEFKQSDKYPVYHKDVQVYEVFNSKTKNFIGLFYTDYFPRASKQGGAWMTEYREQGLWNQSIERPHVAIVCNFTKPTASRPALLTYDEVNTLFHEFGHALHGLLSQCTYRSLSGTRVYWDFVELPSQFMENFLLEKEVLDLFAEHYQSKEKIPTDLISKLKKSAKFQSGYFCMRQLQFALLDMAWHHNLAKIPDDINQFELEITKDTRLMDPVEGTAISTSFSHIFAGGYSSGYYSYKWAEVLDADAFEEFKRHGVLNPDVAEKFRTNILEKGGTAHPMELYKAFRGQEPDLSALLKRDGLI